MINRRNFVKLCGYLSICPNILNKHYQSTKNAVALNKEKISELGKMGPCYRVKTFSVKIEQEIRYYRYVK